MYEPQNFDRLLGLEGFSDQLLKNHFTLYQGYVTNTNKLMDELRALAADEKLATPAASELRRRLGWEWNGMRLHELYFGNMSAKGGMDTSSLPIQQKIESQFGSMEAWTKDFKAAGAMRGIGWVILYHDRATDKLVNAWINEHDAGHLAGSTPILLMDVFEHAFMLDYGLKRADYIEAFFKAIDWGAVDGRRLT
ncbi:superoxide dismutase [Candidatus Uhrbacteria bacterium]|nr:superoxide dismutase [Candidatus Uhrbacteria bacterium]